MSIIDYLVLPKGAKKNRKRLGRGESSGHGKTSCHGNKGQQARGNTKKFKGYEGGQMPLIRRIPKRGFTNKFRKVFEIVNISLLNNFADGSVIDAKLLKMNGILSDEKKPFKVLGEGKLEKKLDVRADAFSKKAKEAIEKTGGKAVLVRKNS